MTPGGVAVTGSNGGTFIVQPDGSYVFVPGTSFQHLPEGQTATTTISYVVTDPSGATSTATVEVTVVGVNDPARITPAQAGDDEVRSRKTCPMPRPPMASSTWSTLMTANRSSSLWPTAGHLWHVLDRCQWQLGLQPEQ